MVNPDFNRLYSEHIRDLKPAHGSSQQYMGKCPFHDDGKPSFAVQMDTGLCHCFAGCFSGNGYQFAQKVGDPNPTAYINGESFTKPPRIEQNPNLSKIIQPMVEELINNPKHMPNCWDIEVVKDMGVGFANGKPQFAHHDINGCVIAIHQHRGPVMGVGESKWYLIHKIKDYDTNKPLYIAEGEKDAITLRSMGLQVVSNTTGCQSIPKDKDGYYDLAFFKLFKEIYIVYDNDDAGRKGAKRLGEEIIKTPPHMDVKIARWDRNLPKGYDVTDAFEIDDEIAGHSFYNACSDAEVLEPQFKGYKVLSLNQYMDTDFDETFPIIKYLLYSQNITILAGETGAGKSMCALQMGLSIASGLPVFGHFEVTKQKVLLVQFENENFDIKSRLEKMVPQFTNQIGVDWMTDFDLVEIQPDDELFEDNWKKIEDTLIERGFHGGVLIVDNLYTSTNKEIQKNSEMALLLKQIIRIKKVYNLTMLLVAHPNKGVNIEKDLTVDQIQGGKTLTNIVSNVVQLHTSSTSVDLRIMKITKGGRCEHNELNGIPFKLKWDESRCIFTKGAIIKNIAAHFESVSERWEMKLLKEVASSMEMKTLPQFDREQFLNHIPDEHLPMPDYKLTRLLVRLIEWGMIDKTGHNKYRLVRDELDEQ